MNTDLTERKSKTILTIIFNTLLVLSIAALIFWGISTYFNLDDNLYTNDAQIEEYINPVNTRIPGYIKKVNFNEHQHVKKGDTLVVIDDSEYNIALEQAQASYLSTQASKNVTSSSVNTVESNLSVSDANIAAAKARLWNSDQNLSRYKNLLQEGAATQQQFDQIKTEFDALSAQLKALVQQRRTTSLSTNETVKKVKVNEAEILRAHASLALAELNLSYTVILAPYDGFTGRRTVQEGQLLQAGQTLLSFVRDDNKWVVANYKETQVEKLRIGQRMKLKIDGISHREFQGEITAISQATGSRYSGVPTDNSTGNFIKVRQRIPVKIDFVTNQDSKDFDELRAGMNVEVRIAN